MADEGEVTCSNGARYDHRMKAMKEEGEGAEEQLGGGGKETPDERTLLTQEV